MLPTQRLAGGAQGKGAGEPWKLQCSCHLPGAAIQQRNACLQLLVWRRHCVLPAQRLAGGVKGPTAGGEESGVEPFEAAMGQPMWQWLAERPEEGAVFSKAMGEIDSFSVPLPPPLEGTLIAAPMLWWQRSERFVQNSTASLLSQCAAAEWRTGDASQRAEACSACKKPFLLPLLHPGLPSAA